MWIASVYGWFSIKREDDEDGREIYHVRARRKGDLENLLGAIKAPFPETIYESQKADYLYRIVVSQMEFLRIMGALWLSVDYENFKGRIDELPDQRDKHGYYSRIWGVMHGYQQDGLLAEHGIDSEAADIAYGEDFQNDGFLERMDRLLDEAAGRGREAETGGRDANKPD